MRGGHRAGTASAGSRRWLVEQRGLRCARVPDPGADVRHTGHADLLFSIARGYRELRGTAREQSPVKMIWHCGGHGVCPSAQAYDRRHLAQAALTWLRRWLDRDEAIDTGALLEWQDDAGQWRSSERFPLPRVGTLDASGSGGVDDHAAGHRLGRRRAAAGAGERGGCRSGLPGSAPRRHGARRPDGEHDLPRHRCARAHVRVRADRRRRDQHDRRLAVTPLPVVLDGRTRTLGAHPGATRRARTIKLALPAAVTGATSLFALQTAVGLITVERLHGTLPLADPGARALAASALRTPPRLRLSAKTRRVGRATWKIVVRSRLRSKPCSGHRDAHAAPRRRATDGPHEGPPRLLDHARRAPERRRGRRVRISARFDGNAELHAPPLRQILRRLR